MKLSLAKMLSVGVSATLLTFAGTASAEEFHYPVDDPHTSITFPDKWKVEPDGNVIHAGPKDGSLYFGLLALPEDFDNDKVGEAIGEAIDQVVSDFKEGETSTLEVNDITLYYTDATGKSRETGEKLDVSMAYFSADNDPKHMMAIVYFGTKEAEKKHQKDLEKVISSIKNPNADEDEE